MNTFLLYIYSLIVFFVPDTRCFVLKRFLLRLAGAKIGKNVKICSTAHFLGNKRLEIGDNTWIGHYALIICSEDVFIGANCDIAPNVFIGTGTHVIDVNSPNIAGNGVSLPIKIGDGSWLCANCTILPGSTIGNKCIIAAGAVVKGDVPSLELWGGIIAKFIRKIE